MIVARQYQENIAARCTVAFAVGRHPLVIAPTGSGKGDMLTAALRAATAAGERSLFLVHIDEVLRDVAARLQRAGVPSLRVLAGSHAEGDADAPVTVASFQTMARRGITLDAHLVVVDEAHRSRAATFDAVLQRHLAAGARLLGFTATGQRGDGSGLGAVGFNTIVAGPQIAELVAAGYLAPIRTIAPVAGYVEELAADPVDAWLQYAAGQPGIIFAASLQHSRDIAAGLRVRGLAATHVDGDTPDDQRTLALDAFNAGTLDVLCNYRLFVEGVNAPRATVVMLASGFSHAGPMLQAVGRVRRFMPGKVALLIDLRGNIFRHGLPDDERVYSLDGVGCKGAAANDVLPVRCCRACLGWSRPLRTCPLCGARVPAPKRPKVTIKAMAEIKAARAMTAAIRNPEAFAAWCAFVEERMAKGKTASAIAFAWKMARGTFAPFTVAQALAVIEAGAADRKESA